MPDTPMPGMLQSPDRFSAVLSDMLVGSVETEKADLAEGIGSGGSAPSCGVTAQAMARTAAARIVRQPRWLLARALALAIEPFKRIGRAYLAPVVCETTCTRARREGPPP
jgi:hypothetical protein